MPTRFTVDGFKSNFRDGHRSNLFYFIPNFPSDVITGGMNNERAVYLVKTANMPGASFEEILLSWQGFDFPIAGKHTFADLTITFNVDYSGSIRQNFEKWLNKIHNPVTNQWAPIREYMLDQKLQLLDYNGYPILEVTLKDAWPREIATAALDYAANEISMFDVTFRYSYHLISNSPTGW